MTRHQLTTSLGMCPLFIAFVAMGLDNDCLDDGTDAGSRCDHDAAAEQLNGLRHGGWRIGKQSMWSLAV